MSEKCDDKIIKALDVFRIELPSWGFANTGTRFGKFIQPAAASTIEEKLSDAGQVHLLTGACPTVALHVLWDFKDGVGSVDTVRLAAQTYGVLPGSINPNVFQNRILWQSRHQSPASGARSCLGKRHNRRSPL